MDEALKTNKLVEWGKSEDQLPVQSLFNNASDADWRELSAPLFAITPLRSKAMQRQFNARAWGVGPCLFFRSSSGGQLVRRTLDHVSILGQFIIVSRYVSGRLTGSDDDGPFGVVGGDIVVRDFSRPFDGLQYPSAVEAAIIPYRLLGLTSPPIPSLRVLAKDNEASLLLRSSLSEVFEQLSLTLGALPTNVLDRLIGTASAALSGSIAAQNARKAARHGQRTAIRRFIEGNLGRLDLSAEFILPQFGVSRATLYRLFEDDGGVRTYIVRRRLFRAVMDLCDRPRRRGTIQDIARRWGFSSAANFNRSIQAAFGGTPGSLFKVRTDSDLGTPNDSPDARFLNSDLWMALHD